MILSRSFKLRIGLILAFLFLFLTYQYSGLKSYLVANNISYRVQITAILKNRVPVDQIIKKFNLNDSVREDFHKGWFKYSIGNFPDYYEAKKFRDKLISENKTYGAFVVMVKDDIRMDDMDTIQKETVPTFQLNQKVSYRVQIRASATQISINELKTQLNIAEDIIEEFDNNYYKYTVGNFENYDDAKNVFARIKTIDKITDAFIVTYFGNKRIGGYIPEKRVFNKQHEIQNKPLTSKKETSQVVVHKEYKAVKIKTNPQPKKVEPKKVEIKKPKEEPKIIEQKAEIKKVEPPVKIDENTPNNIILDHISPDKLKNISKRAIQISEVKETTNSINSDNYSEKENTSSNASVAEPEVQNVQYPSNRINYETVKDTVKRVKKSFFVRFKDNIRINSDKSFFIWVLVVLIIYFFINLLVVITIVFVSRVRKISKEKKIKKVEEEFQILLAEFLFDPSAEKAAYNKLRNTSGSFKRNILLDELMKLCVDLAGEVLEKLKVLYFNMELDKDSVDKLSNRKWFIKVKGCRELTRMKAYSAKPEIEKLLNSKNEILRAEAQMALIELNEDNPYYFLEKLTQEFLPWEQLNVHVMMQRNSYEIPDFSKWLMVENETVVLFAIEMIRVYRQIMNAPKIIKFFKHQNKNLREAAIIAAGELGYVEVVPEMMKIYNEVEDEYKVMILRSMQRLADDGNKDFLRGIIESNAPQYIKLEAAKAMFALGVKGQIELKRYSQTNDAELNTIVKHVFDERI